MSVTERVFHLEKFVSNQRLDATSDRSKDGPYEQI